MDITEILKELATVETARRGSISEQWHETTSPNGKVYKNGPYYVWQRFINGKKVTKNIPRKDAERAYMELEQGKKVEQLTAQLWDILETRADSPCEKKKR